jgi:hypothetical protein
LDSLSPFYTVDGEKAISTTGAGPAYNGRAMNAVYCAHCRATNVTVVTSDEQAGTITVHCLACGQDSQIEADRFNVDIDDLPVE